MNKYVCPECKGNGELISGPPDNPTWEQCWYCFGTGISSDECYEEKMWEQEFK